MAELSKNVETLIAKRLKTYEDEDCGLCPLPTLVDPIDQVSTQPVKYR